MGERLGRYVIEAEVGRGSMGTVYRARGDDGDVVALKVASPSLAADPVYRRRFEREARIASGLDHPHVVAVLGAGEDDGRLYLVTRLVEGRTLADRIVDGPLRDAETVAIASQLASALDALHDRDLLHRDVKPANVLLDERGNAALADFGLARGAADSVLTQRGRVSGTIDYLAPEVIRGEPATPASDLYALGCVLYECLAGAPPFAGRPVAETILAHLEAQPEPLASPLSDAVLLALAKDPGARPPTATAYALMVRVSRP